MFLILDYDLHFFGNDMVINLAYNICFGLGGGTRHLHQINMGMT